MDIDNCGSWVKPFLNISKGETMRSTIAIVAVVVGAFSLAACSEPSPGPKGEQSPPGPRGKEVSKALRDRKALKASKGFPGRRGRKARTENKVLPGHKDRKGRRAK